MSAGSSFSIAAVLKYVMLGRAVNLSPEVNSAIFEWMELKERADEGILFRLLKHEDEEMDLLVTNLVILLAECMLLADTEID